MLPKRALLAWSAMALAGFVTGCAETGAPDDVAMDVASDVIAPTDAMDDTTMTTPGCASGNRSQCVAESSGGNYFGCARFFDGTVWCWGRNDVNQLGYSTTDVCIEQVGSGMTRSIACHTFPFQVTGIEGSIALASGLTHSCVINGDRSVSCWGGNEGGQLGDGTTLPGLHPGAVAGVANAAQLSLGQRHSCVVANGSVSCWGANDRLQLGVATVASMCAVGSSQLACSKAPVMVAGVTNVAQVSAGAAHTCVRTTDGGVKCWGDNRYGQLGVGAANAMPSAMARPVMIGTRALDHVTSIASGNFHTCALREDGAVFCWGRDDHGELGTAAAATMPAMCVAACIPGATQVNALPHPAAPMTGDAGAGDGGARDASATDAGPVMLNLPVGLAAGADFSCARLTDQTVRCWGSDAVGQLGDGAASTGPQPVALVIAAPGAAQTNPLQDTTGVAAGGVTACARVSDGSLRCWGSNQDGALGIGGTSARNGPVPVNW